MSTIDIASFREREAQGFITCRPHPYEDLLIWNYTARCQFDRIWDEVTMQARGLITKGDGTIVARPFRKFFNYEEYQGNLPLESFKITEKMDGSLGILYFVNGMPYIATRGSFTSEQAERATKILYDRYHDFIPALQGWPYYTLLFEIIYPGNRIVVDYGDMEDLVLLTVIFTETGEEYDIHKPLWVKMWPFPLVRQYDGITDIARLREREEANKEGFVIHFASGLRLKMKYADYVRLHRLITQVNAKTIWELLRNKQTFDDLLSHVPDEYYAWVTSTRDSLLAQFTSIERESRVIYEQVKDIPTRKEQAAIVTKTPYAAVVFRMLDSKDYAEIIWKQIRPQAERPFREDIDA